MGRKKRTARPKKDPVKQRAGQLGAKARWINMLDWHREIEAMRGGDFGGWKLNIRNVPLRYVLLWRANGCPRGTLPGARPKQMAELQGWPESARHEFRSLCKACGVNPTMAVIFARESPGWKMPWLHARWTYRGLEQWVQITVAEAQAMKPSTSKSPSRRDLRQAAVARAWKRLRVRFSRPSIRRVQRHIKEHSGIDASYETVRGDMHDLGCQQPEARKVRRRR